MWEIPIFVIVGLTMGALGSVFVRWNGIVVKVRRKFATRFPRLGSPLAFAFIVATITSVLTFPGFIGAAVNPQNPLQAFKSLIDAAELVNEETTGISGPGYSIPAYASVAIWTASRFFLTPLSLTLPVPTGLFVPVLSIGAGFGRLFGKFLQEYIFSSAFVAGYALVAGGSLVASVTQTLSTSVILMEMTGNLDYLFPILAAIVTSVFVSKALGVSIFDRIVKDKRLPYLKYVHLFHI